MSKFLTSKVVEKLLIPAVFLSGLFFSFNLHKGNKIINVLTSDSEGYYSYLPALFIYDSFKIKHSIDEDNVWVTDCCAIGNNYEIQDKYPIGVAYLESPFFLISHFFTSIFYGKGTPPPENWVDFDDTSSNDLFSRKYHPDRGMATGFSDYYAYGILIAGIFYVSLGLWFLKEYLKRLFSLPVALLTSVLILYGTNLFYYAFIAPGMSHVYSFFLIAFFLWQIPEFIIRPGLKRSIIIGITFGLICLTRPTNIIIGFLILLYETYSLNDIKERMKWVKSSFRYLLVIVAAMFIVAIPQFLYFKSQYGTFLANAYVNEHFSNWNHPQIGNVLFSHQNGLFLYAPVLLFIIPGLVIGFMNKKGSPGAVLLIFSLATYIFASWWAWWFGGAFGHRCFIDFLPLLALPLGLFVEWVSKKIYFTKILVGIFFLIFIFANIKMSYLHSHAQPWDGQGWKLENYWEVWGKVADPFRYWW